MITRPRLRQLGLGELLDESFRLYRSNFLTFVSITALVLVPYQIVSFLVQLPFQGELAALQNASGAGATVGAESPFDVFTDLLFWYLGLLGIGLLYAVVFLPLLEGALTHAISQRYLGRSTAVGESFGAAVRRSPALIGARLIPTLFATLLFGLFVGLFVGLIYLMVGRGEPSDSSAIGALGLGFLGIFFLVLLTIACIALYVRIFFTSQTIMVEGQGPWQSIRRSWQLTHRYFWRTVGYLLVIIILMYFLAGLPVTVIVTPLALFGLEYQTQLLISTVVTTVFSVIATPFSLITYTLMYFDLRIRKEGFDIEQQTSAMFSPEPTLPYPSSR